METNDSNQILEDRNNNRKKRVKKMKQFLIYWLVFATMIPIVFCIILFKKVDVLQKQIEDLYIMNQTAEIQPEQTRVSYDSVSKYQRIAINRTPANVDNNTNTEGKKQVFLTFDDGPSTNTETILEVLKQNNIKATFFVIGKEDEHSKELYKRIVNEGHTLAMHSYSHQYKELYSSVDAFAADLDKIQNYLYEVTGVKSTIYRFPGGSSNKVNKIGMENFIRLMNQRGITYFDWNVSNGDASNKKYTPDQLVDNAMVDVLKYKYSVILMHDAQNKGTTAEALPKLIERIKQETGAEFLPLDQNVTPVQHIKAESVQ